MVAHEALVSALSDAGDWAEVHAELARVLPFLEGERRDVSLLRLAEVANNRGDHALALEHYRALLASAELADDVLATIELLAREQGDGPTTRAVLERRLSGTGEPHARAALLERLGNAFAWQLGDPTEAAAVWLEGARLSEGAGREPERARKLYERVLDANPDSQEAAERLVELSAQAGDWEKLHEVFDTLIRLAKERELILLLVGLEEQALEGGKLAEYVRLIDSALPRIEPGRARHVLFAKARALGALRGQESAAAALYRELLGLAGDDAGSVADGFEAFLRQVEPNAERIADFRWLYEWKLVHAAVPADVTSAWAQTEETLFRDLPAAAELYRRTLDLDPERVEALSELARLELALGDADKALAVLELLRQRSEGDMRVAAELKIAALLFEPLGRAAEAVELCAPILSKNPGEPLALRLLHRALSVPEARARAALLLERVAEAAENADTRADVIEALLAVSHDAPELAAARSRWLTQLLKTKDEEPGEALRIALRGAESAPGEEALWTVAEEMSRRLNDPNPLAEAFERAIGRELEPELADTLGRRVVEFYEEWFDDPERVVKLLERVLELCPGAGWAFDRLKLAFNAAGRWSELFVLYDRRLSAPIAASEAIDILREAAMAAKDFAGDAERAIGYLERLNKLSPGDARVDAALERLYERHAHKRPLIELLSARLPGAGDVERGELNGRIAALWLDLGEPVPAFEIASKMLGSERDVASAVALLERTIAMPASAEQRLGKKGRNGSVLSNAARLLKDHYRGSGSTVDVVRMLEIEVDCSEERADKIERLEEIVGLRLEALSDAGGAFETVAALVQLKPDSDAYRARFAELAAQTGAHERRAEVLIGVARGDLSPALTASLRAAAGDG
jgi:tetratricopeptide (TPR) repeat protein